MALAVEPRDLVGVAGRESSLLFDLSVYRSPSRLGLNDTLSSKD